jgi:hypothetical protein
VTVGLVGLSTYGSLLPSKAYGLSRQSGMRLACAQNREGEDLSEGPPQPTIATQQKGAPASVAVRLLADQDGLFSRL